MMIGIEEIPIVGARLAAMLASTRAIDDSRSRQPRMLQSLSPTRSTTVLAHRSDGGGNSNHLAERRNNASMET